MQSDDKDGRSTDLREGVSEGPFRALRTGNLASLAELGGSVKILKLPHLLQKHTNDTQLLLTHKYSYYHSYNYRPHTSET